MRICIAAFFLLTSSTASLADEMNPFARHAFEQAFAAMQKGKIHEAELAYEIASMAAPDSQDVWLEYTIALRKTGRLQRAARAGWRAVELGDAAVGPWANLGNVFVSAHAWDAANMAFKRAESLSDDKKWSVQNFLNVGYAQWIAGDFKGAEKIFKYALRKDRTSGMATLDLACVHASQGKAKTALKEIDKAIKLLEKEGNSRGLSYARSLRSDLERSGRLDPPRKAGPSYQSLPKSLLERPEAATASELEIAETVRKFFVVPDLGVFSIEVPEEWSEATDSAKRGPPVFAFRPRKEGDFLIQISPVFREPSLAAVKSDAERAGRKALRDAVEDELELVEVLSETAQGYVSVITDKNLVDTEPEEGEFRHMAQGAFKVDDVECTYTLLFMERTEEFLQSHFEVMKSMPFQQE